MEKRRAATNMWQTGYTWFTVIKNQVKSMANTIDKAVETAAEKAANKIVEVLPPQKVGEIAMNGIEAIQSVKKVIKNVITNMKTRDSNTESHTNNNFLMWKYPIFVTGYNYEGRAERIKALPASGDSGELVLSPTEKYPYRIKVWINNSEVGVIPIKCNTYPEIDSVEKFLTIKIRSGKQVKIHKWHKSHNGKYINIYLKSER